MPIAEMTTTRKQTWRDWLGPDGAEPDKLFTRDEIAEQASGIDAVTPDDIRYWEYQGVLPRSIRQWHNGAVRATYPGWYTQLAMFVRQLQRQGLTLDEITPRVRRRAHELLHMTVTAYRGEVPEALVSALNAYAYAQRQAFSADSPVAHIEVAIRFEDESGITAAVPVVPPADQE
jgi:DNA-binding transcriptional MerR regulator